MLSDSVSDADSNAVKRASLASHVFAIIDLEIWIFPNFAIIHYVAQRMEQQKRSTAFKISLFRRKIALSDGASRFQKKTV